MSDTDVDYGPDDPSDLILRDQRQTMSTAIASLDDDPQKAARSFELGEATGDHPAVIYGNLENYENQHKAALTAQLLNSSKYLRQYVDADPMHAKLSNDDYGNLDAVSSAVSKFSSTRTGQIFRAPEAIGGGIFEGAMEGFKKGWDNITNPSHLKDEEIKDYPLFTALMQSARFPVDVGGALISAGAEAIKGGTKAGYQAFTGDEQGAERFSREMAGMAETVLTNTSGYHGIHAPSPAQLEKVHGIIDRAKPWLDDGKEPPRGLDPEIDKLKFEQNKIDVDNLDEALKASTQSATRERNPDIFAGFIRQHTDAKIGISGDAVAKLYGDKIPEPGDNLLGWSPGLAEELETAKATGGDVHVPLADWLAKVDPEVAKALHDDIRVRPGGITNFEKDAFAEAKEGLEDYKPAEPLPDPLPSIRAASALEPLFSIGDRKLELKRNVTQAQLKEKAGGLENFHDFDLLDEQGQRVGNVNLSEQNGGKELYIEMIQGGPAGSKLYNPNSMGPALMRDLLRQLKAEFPEAETITGHRVSGAREKAESYMKPSASPVIKLDKEAGTVDVVNFREMLANAGYQEYAKGLHVYVKPTELYTNNERALVKAVNDEVKRLIPKGLETQEASDIVGEHTDASIHGSYIEYTDRAPLLLWSLEAPDSIETARHEAIHHLRSNKFFSPAEWDTLSRAARDQNWKDRFEIDDKYPDLGNADKLEEAIAEKFAEWNKKPEFETTIGKIFTRLKELMDAIKTKFKEILGKEPTWEELFQKIDTGEIGSRTSKSITDAGFKTQIGDDKPESPFGKGAIMPVTQQKLYDKLIQQRHTEDLTSSLARAEAEQRKRQTKEWKSNAAEVRSQVEENVRNRPDIAADMFFGSGELYGDKLKSKPRLNESDLTPEQIDRLPKEYIAKAGLNPDDVAGVFGYSTGDAMIAKLGELNEAKLQSGLDTRAFTKRLVDMETERQMQAKYGNLEQSILEHAEEQALSENQLNILHEETLKLAIDAGLEFSISKSDLKSAIKEQFDRQPIGSHDAKEYLTNVGKAGKAIELALLKGDAAEAYRQAQRKEIAFLYAQEAKKLEKERTSLDRTAKVFRKREIPSVEGEYTNHIQDLLQRIGYRIDRSIQNIQENIESKSAKNIADFANEKLIDSFGYRDIPVADVLNDPEFRKPLDELSVWEFRGVKQTIDALIKNGRNEKKIIREGEAADLNEIKAKMLEQLRTFPLKTYKATKGTTGKALDLPKVFLAGSTNMETMFNRFDRDDPRGVFNKFIVYPLAKAANYKSRLDREYSKPYRDLGEIVNAKKLVESPFNDPLSITPENPIGSKWVGFNRTNVMALLQNAGNKSNLRVTARGYGIEPEALMDWLHRNTTKEDWDRAQKLGDIFKDLIGKADGVYERINGITVDKIPLEPIETPFGTYDGWYHPLIADPIRKGKQPVRGGAYDDSDFGHATTANGYTKKRTGATYPVDLNFDRVPSRIKQMIHDIAFREVVLETQKVFKDPKFHNEVTAHYGEHYSDLLMPYLRSIAGAESIPSKAGAKAAQLSEYLRQNVISTYIGFNPYTALKHGPTAAVMSSREVGPINFANAVKSLYGQSPELGTTNSAFAMKWSEELQRRERHWQDTIAGQHKELEGATTTREGIIEKGSWLVAKSDMLSAKPTWVARYNSAIKEGSDHGEAVDLADRAVRRAHGSTAETNQPAIVRGGGPLHGWLTSVYGFFGTAMQRRIEIAHEINDAYQLGKDGELKSSLGKVPGIMADVFTYVIWPTMIEEWVTGLTTDDRRGWGSHIASAAFLGMASSVLYLRDLVHAFVTGQDPGVGLLSSPLHDVSKLVRDLKQGKKMFSKEHAGKTVQDALTVFGEGTGMAPKTLDSAARFGIDLMNGQAKPKNFTDWRMGLTRGTTKKREEH